MPPCAGVTVFVPSSRPLATLRICLWLYALAILGLLVLRWLQGDVVRAASWSKVFILPALLGFMCLAGWLALRYRRAQRLIADDQGLHYQSGALWVLRRLYDWSFQWEDLRSQVATIIPSQAISGLQSVELRFALRTGTHGPLPVAAWVFQEHPQEVGLRFADTVTTRVEELETLLQRFPLLQYLVQQRGMTVQIDPTVPTQVPFYLSWNRYSLTVVGLLCGLLGALMCLGALTPAAERTEVYATHPPWGIPGLSLLLFSVVLVRFFRRGHIPWDHTLATTLILVIWLGLLLIPGLLFLNVLTDAHGPRPYTYTLTALDDARRHALFLPPQHDLPPLALDDVAYRKQFPLQSPHVFVLRKGGLGFFQLDMRAHHAAIDAWSAR